MVVRVEGRGSGPDLAPLGGSAFEGAGVEGLVGLARVFLEDDRKLDFDKGIRTTALELGEQRGPVMLLSLGVDFDEVMLGHGHSLVEAHPERLLRGEQGVLGETGKTEES